MSKKSVFSAFLVVIFALSVALFNGSAYAVTGQCSNCHTMHNSQDGKKMGESDTPQEMLLLAGCVACHTAGTGPKSTYGAPAVLHTTAPGGQGAGKTNAGGDFYWVANGADATGHNVKDITGVGLDGQLGRTPPGWESGVTAANGFGAVTGPTGTWSGKQLTCAGMFGCHGDHTVEGSFPGVKGAHHLNTGLTETEATTANTVGNSFRFLGGIFGLENSDWNWTESAGDHNEYYGVNTLTNREYGHSPSSYVNRNTISFLCAECHGQFHSQIASDNDGNSPWVRHPTDIFLPQASTEYAAYTVYNPMAPIARSTTAELAGVSSSVDGSDVVICLSCHRAHGSPENDLLRWSYTGMVAGGGAGAVPGTGCFICHTTKDDTL